MSFYSKFIFIIIALSIEANISAQMVNVESLRPKNDSNLFSLNTNLNIQFRKNNDNKLTNLGLDFLTSFKTKNKVNIFYLISQSSYNNTNDIDISNSLLLHLRYNRKINKYFFLEGFSQFQNNKVLDLKFRRLFGLGPRFILVGKPNTKIYLGSIYMIEYEQLFNSPSSDATYNRLSSYLSVSYKLPNKTATFSSVTYWQPRLDKFIDYRFSSQSEISVNLFKKIALLFQLNYYYDAEPPLGIKSNNFEFKNGIQIMI